MTSAPGFPLPAGFCNMAPTCLPCPRAQVTVTLGHDAERPVTPDADGMLLLVVHMGTCTVFCSTQQKVFQTPFMVSLPRSFSYSGSPI